MSPVTMIAALTTISILRVSSAHISLIDETSENFDVIQTRLSFIAFHGIQVSSRHQAVVQTSR